ncbi:hypothetical protein [Streptomyces sp. NPDC091371]|uniref:hypothetical protein n=1 Tax=Streptomyces sp. NPDC091371 TaxID=3155303 RepID=UPI003434F17C
MRTQAQEPLPLRDQDWPGAVRCAVVCSGALLALLLFTILLPDRISAGDGWIAARGLFREQRVRTDCLVHVQGPNEGLRRLVLQDRHGARAELDAKASGPA